LATIFVTIIERAVAPINGHRGAKTPENFEGLGAGAWSAPEHRLHRPVILGEAHGRDATP
jgi:hypothetical protein